MKVLDLCAGTGSATKAFLERGHEVDTLDITGNHTYVCDVRSFISENKYDFIWASPPCTELSLLKRKKCKDRKPDLSIVKACFEICKTASYWILENPRACLRHFIGLPTKTVLYRDYGAVCCKPTDLWGIFPDFNSDGIKKKPQMLWRDAYPKHMDQGGTDRAEIPYGLSLSICKALECRYV